MEHVLIALGIFLIIEGIAPALFPNKWRAYLHKLTEQPIETIRTMGTVAVLAGVLLLYVFY